MAPQVITIGTSVAPEKRLRKSPAPTDSPLAGAVSEARREASNGALPNEAAPDEASPHATSPHVAASGSGSSSNGLSRISATDLPRLANDWLLDCDYRMHSPQTIKTRRVFLNSLAWFLDHRQYASCGTPELKEFLHYLRHGHEEAGGRWGKKQFNKSVRPETVKDYWVCFSTFFKWLVAEEILPASPMTKIPKPVARFEEKQPLTPDQVKAVIDAARRSLHPRRDEAILLLLLDTGIRSSELCGIRLRDIDLHSRQCSVLGKGDKFRTVHFGTNTGQALRLYLRQRCGEPDEPLFLADKTHGAIRPLTRSGLQQLMKRLGKVAGLQRSCSPHVWRRTFAVTWLRNGANVYSLQKMLGHCDLRVSLQYLSLSSADIADQAQQFSPADRLRDRPRSKRA